MRILLLLPFFLAILKPVSAQITFKRLYGTPGNDEARYVEPLGDGSFLVAGLSGQDALIARIGGNGTVVWSRSYGGSGTDIFTQVLSCSDGNFIALGETNSFGAGGVDLYIVKFDPNGNVIWERTAGGANTETARGITEVSDGYVITGGSQSIGAGFWDIYIEKIDVNGVTQWNRAWGGGGGDIAGQPLAAGNGEIWLTGFTFISSGNHDPILFRIAANGNLLSATHYSIPVNNGLNGLASGGAGMVSGGGTWVGNSHFPLIVNFNSSGAVAWARRYPIPGGNFGCLYAEPSSDGGVIFAANEIQNDLPDAVIVKTNSNGDVDWAKSFPYESAGRLFHVRPVPGGGYVAVGYAFGSGRDWFILKMDATGEVQQCCPEDVAVSPVSISPGLVSFSPAQASGAATAASPGNDASLSLSFQDICNGPICCDPLTAAIAPAPAITCNNPIVSLNGGGSTTGSGIAYQWSGPGIVSGGNTLQPLVNQPGTYVLTVTDPANGCTASDQVEIGLDTLSPIIAIAQPGLLTCTVSQVQLQASGPGPGMLLLWETAGGMLLSGAETLAPVAGAPGIYQLTATDPQNGCQRSASVTVEQDIEPPLADAGEGFVFPCDQDEVFLSGAASSASGQWLAEWTAAGGQILSGVAGLTPLILGGGTYVLEVTDPQNGCTGSDSVFVSENAPFGPEILPDQPRCEETQGQLTVAGVSGGTPPFLYSADGGATFQSSPVFAGLLPGAYAIVVQDALGCETLPEESQILAPQPVEITLEASAALLQGDSYQINTHLNLPDSAIQAVVWTPAAGLSCTDCLRPLATPLQTASYTLEVTDLNGCTARAAIQIVVDQRAGIFVPNVFSPNGDGENDRFLIFANDANIREIRSFLVFDRWGEMVFENYRFLPNNPAYGWDGTFHGKPLDPAVFVWFAEIELIDGRIEVVKGDIVLVK